MQPTSLRFAAASRALAHAARNQGLVVPAFRSPPGRRSSVRTIRRGRSGTVTVAVAIHDRPWGLVVADMIDGVTVANELSGPAADAWREAGWMAIEGDGRAQAA
ncbi:MAG TPA: hypothetical protein VMW08_17725 [Acidimicrobiales bacterium]|nr:hypothetical protein [Acidimicrobiales bacterium]